MDKISLGAIQSLNNLSQPAKTTPYEAQQSFQNFLQNALEKVNDSQVQADVATQNLLSGKTDNLHQVMITAEKANITLQTTLEIRNKVVEAYQEIMRMQV